MAGRIKGITVEIGGDTTGLEKALSVIIPQPMVTSHGVRAPFRS